MRWAVAAVAFTSAVATLLWIEAPSALLGYDQMFQLTWAVEMVHGHAPRLGGAGVPTPHPLETLVTIPLAPLGAIGEDILRAIVLVSFPAAAVALARIGTLIASPAVGILAAALLVSRPHLAELAQHGDPDVPAFALLAWSAAIAADRRHRRDAAVLGLLAAAGLLRPEPWLFAIGYAVWAGRTAPARRGAWLIALALLGPALWGVHDWVLGGVPFWSFMQTRTNTALRDVTGLSAAVRLLPHHLGYLVALPALLVGVLGVSAGLLWLRRAAAAPAIVGAAFTLGFVGYGIVGLALSPRFLVGFAGVICLFAAIGALGWTAVEGSRRSRWRVLGLVGLGVLAVGVPWDVGKHAAVRAALRDQGASLEPLARHSAAALRRCRPVVVTAGGAVPYLAYWTGVPPRRIIVSPKGRTGAGAVVTPTSSAVSDLAGRPPIVAPLLPRAKSFAANRAWQIHLRCPLRRRVSSE